MSSTQSHSCLSSAFAKSDSIKTKLHNGEMMVPGDYWPIFLYANYEYDSNDPWTGLFRSTILVSVCDLPLTY